MRIFLQGILTASLVLALAACGSLSRNIAADGTSADLVWPDPGDTTPMHEGGTFPGLDRLRKMRAGLNKQQIADLIGYPHFSEGFAGVREWNYLFRFIEPGGDAVTVCQYKVLFDQEQLARSFYWKPASCADILKETLPPAPAPAEAVSRPAPRVMSADAMFAFGKATLSPAGRHALDDLALELEARGDALHSVHIAGYTDRLGDDAYNRTLSQRRADAVKDYLVAQGVPAERMIAEGFGDADAVKDCRSQTRSRLIACLAPNRRVEVRIAGGR